MWLLHGKGPPGGPGRERKPVRGAKKSFGAMLEDERLFSNLVN